MRYGVESIEDPTPGRWSYYVWSDGRYVGSVTQYRQGVRRFGFGRRRFAAIGAVVAADLTIEIDADHCTKNSDQWWTDREFEFATR